MVGVGSVAAVSAIAADKPNKACDKCCKDKGKECKTCCADAGKVCGKDCCVKKAKK